MAQVNVNTSDIHTREASALLNIGRYVVEISRCDLVAKKKDGKAMVVVEGTIKAGDDPKTVGLRLQPQFLDAEPDAHWAKRRDLAEFAKACGFDLADGTFDTDWCEGKAVVVEVGILPAKDGYPAKNVINQWMPINVWTGPVNAPPAKPAAAPAAAAPAAAPIADDENLF